MSSSSRKTASASPLSAVRSVFCSASSAVSLACICRLSAVRDSASGTRSAGTCGISTSRFPPAMLCAADESSPIGLAAAPLAHAAMAEAMTSAASEQEHAELPRGPGDRSDLGDRLGDAQDGRFAAPRGRYRDVELLDAVGLRDARGDAGLAAQRGRDFGAGGVVVHLRGVVARVGQYGPVCGHDGDAHVGFGDQLPRRPPGAYPLASAV